MKPTRILEQPPRKALRELASRYPVFFANIFSQSLLSPCFHSTCQTERMGIRDNEKRKTNKTKNSTNEQIPTFIQGIKLHVTINACYSEW